MKRHTIAAAIAAFALLPCAGTAVAQCVYDFPYRPWPDALTFDPPNPAPGQPFTAVVGGGITNYYIDTTAAALSGRTLEVRVGLISTGIGVPPPPAPLRLPLEGLANGTYTVRISAARYNSRIDEPGALICAPITAQVAVGDGINAIVQAPALDRASLALLLTLTALAGGYALRGRGAITRRPNP